MTSSDHFKYTHTGIIREQSMGCSNIYLIIKFNEQWEPFSIHKGQYVCTVVLPTVNHLSIVKLERTTETKQHKILPSLLSKIEALSHCHINQHIKTSRTIITT